MSVTLREVIEAGGYDLDTVDDARWLLSVRAEFDDLVMDAEELIEESENSEPETGEDELMDEERRLREGE